MQVIPIFPTPIFVYDLDLSEEEQSILLKVSITPTVDEKMLNGEKVNDVWTNLSDNRQILRTAGLERIRDKILVNSKKLANEVMGCDIDEMIDVLSWVNEKPSDREHRTHTHPNSFISGVLYFDEQYDDSQPLVFEKHPGNNAVCQLIPKRNPNIQTEYSTLHVAVPAMKGRLVLFPSHQPHFIPKGEPGKIRRSLSFNLMPKGSLGDLLHLTEFQYMTALQY